jgi:phage N-6-adenine-methyltransferase
MAGIHKPVMGKDEWLTPPEVLAKLGSFDLDPCSPVIRPWATAAKHYTIEDDGLAQAWTGRVWLNPPYGREAAKWLERLADHGDGIALIFARTETEAFFSYVWDKADAVFFFRGRLSFHHVTGEKADNNGGAPSCLVAYGRSNADVLAKLSHGKYVRL